MSKRYTPTDCDTKTVMLKLIGAKNETYPYKWPQKGNFNGIAVILEIGKMHVFHKK